MNFCPTFAMNASLFEFDAEATQATVSVSLDGTPVALPAGMSVAAALLARGELVTRLSPSCGRPCSPHCLMGVCFECWMEIDGVSRQACLTEVREGMVINRFLDHPAGART
jgi:predicted molibdopterin-dependent oxidoreductase YjgC